MSQPLNRFVPRHQLRRGLLGLLAMAVLTGWLLMPGRAQLASDQQLAKGANYKQAYKYSPEFLRQFVYSTAVQPNWIGKTDSFWYQYNTSKGKQWYKVNAREATKEPLFDRVKVGAQLSEAVRKPLDPNQLPLTGVSLNDEATKLKFLAEGFQFEYDLRSEKLTKLGKAPVGPPGPGNMSPEQAQKLKELLGEEKFKEFLEQQKQKDEKKDNESSDFSLEERFADLDMYVQEALALLEQMQAEEAGATAGGEEEQQQKKGGGKGGKGQPKDGGKAGDPRVYSPDKKLYAYALNNNLYLAEEGKEDEATKLTSDGADQYTFNAAGAGFGSGIGDAVLDQKVKEKDKDKKVRPSVVWSKDSKVFYATRSDSRGIKELFLVNNVANPRPTLTRYTYPMPGDENIRKTELHLYNVAKKKLIRIEQKWKDERYTDLHWGKSPDE